MSEFKAGDLAMLTHPDNFGATVELVSFHVGPHRIDFPGGHFQEIPCGTSGWIVKGEAIVSENILGIFSYVSELAFREKWLMPLRGNFQHEREKSQEVPA